MPSNPTVNPAVLLSAGEEGYLAFDPISNKLHRLNPVASLIAELCDGTRSVEDIHELLTPLNLEGGAAAVAGCIEQGIEAGLFVWPGTPPAAKPALSVPELSELAARLSDRGELQPAFLCRKRIAELTPSDPGAWYELGNAAYYLGRREDARYSYAKYLESRPEDARLHQIMAALKGEAPPPRAPDECIRQIYRSFSANYDALMREELEYQSPEHVQKLVEKTHPGRNNLKVLDLGCGSGLSGIHLRPRADELTGVDLSPEMIAVAGTRNTYDRLEVAEGTEWLDRGGEGFDLIVACEVLVYFGDLGGVTRSVSRRLNDGGVFVFTVERGDQPGYHLTDTGRYTHDATHIADVAETAGLTIEQLELGTLRLENGVPVIGIVAALRKKALKTLTQLLLMTATGEFRM